MSTSPRLFFWPTELHWSAFRPYGKCLHSCAHCPPVRDPDPRRRQVQNIWPAAKFPPSMDTRRHYHPSKCSCPASTSWEIRLSGHRFILAMITPERTTISPIVYSAQWPQRFSCESYEWQPFFIYLLHRHGLNAPSETCMLSN